MCALLGELGGLPVQQRLLAHQCSSRRILDDQLGHDLAVVAETIDELSLAVTSRQQPLGRRRALLDQSASDPLELQS